MAPQIRLADDDTRHALQIRDDAVEAESPGGCQEIADGRLLSEPELEYEEATRLQPDGGLAHQRPDGVESIRPGVKRRCGLVVANFR